MAFSFPTFRYKSFYPSGPETTNDYSRLVSEAHASRVKRYIDETKGTVVLGGQTDVEKKYIAPTVVKDVPFEDALMEEYVVLRGSSDTELTNTHREIFGPVLPIVPVKDVDEAIDLINSR